MWWLRKNKPDHKVMSAHDPKLPKSVSDIPKFMKENPPTMRRKKRRLTEDDGLLTGMVIGVPND